MTQADVEGAVREALAGLEYEFEFIERDGGTMSSPDTPLYAAIEEFLPEIEPGADGGARDLLGVHRQPLDARRVRLRRLRLHADARWTRWSPAR